MNETNLVSGVESNDISLTKSFRNEYVDESGDKLATHLLYKIKSARD